MSEMSFDDRRSFDKMFGELDGRLKRPIGELHVKAGFGIFKVPSWLEPVFCNCGAKGGFVTKGTPAIYVCDQCTETIGRLPLPEIQPGDFGYRPAKEG